MSAEVVPFGKYKGQPVEALVADRDYSEWLMSQPWFRERFGNLYQVVINYGAEPQDSPEHNQMQAAFLDPAWRLGLAVLGCNAVSAGTPEFESNGWDVLFGVGVRATYDDGEPCTIGGICRVELKPDLGDDFPAVLRQVKSYKRDRHAFNYALVVVRRYSFEAVTWDQVVSMFASSGIKLVLESDIKPVKDNE